MDYSKKAYFYNNVLPKIMIAVVVLGSILLFSAVTATTLYFTVNVTTVFCDGEMEKVYSFTSDTDEIVAKTAFKVEEKDRIIPYETDSRQMLIAIAKEHTVKVYDEEKFIKKFRFTGTVREAVEKAGLTLRKGDEADVDLDFGITEDMKITVRRAFKVKITADGKTETYRLCEGTTESLLKKAGITLGDNDIVSPERGEKISDETTITVKRVRFEHETVKGEIPFETKVEYDDSKFEDEARVKTKGKNGKKTETVRKIYVDGEYTESKVVETVVNKKAVTKVVVRGSKPRPGGYLGGYVTGRSVISELTPPFKIELDENNRPIKYKKVITGKATAYCTGTTCSTGVRAMPGRVAVDPREIPYGTKMYIVSSDGRWNYGYCTASDTGGFIHNSSTVVDLYMRSYNDCVNFGRRNVDIYILEWG